MWMILNKKRLQRTTSSESDYIRLVGIEFELCSRITRRYAYGNAWIGLTTVIVAERLFASLSQWIHYELILK